MLPISSIERDVGRMSRDAAAIRCGRYLILAPRGLGMMMRTLRANAEELAIRTTIITATRFALHPQVFRSSSLDNIEFNRSAINCGEKIGFCEWNPRFAPLFLVNPSRGAEDATPEKDGNQGEAQMITKQLVLAGCAAMVLNIATAQAGPCNTVGKSAQDAGAGPTPGNTGQTIGTGSPNTGQHPPTDGMNRATGDVASSSQDAQRQMQGQPTAAQQAQGADPSAKMTDQNQPGAAQQAQGAEPSSKMADQGC